MIHYFGLSLSLSVILHPYDSILYISCLIVIVNLLMQASKKTHAVKDHGEKLVGREIKVWWPKDRE